MMTKLLSLMLSFTMIFMSVAPSYAQAVSAERVEREVRRYDSMKMDDCERDNQGNVKSVDFTNGQNRESFEHMMSNPDAWEWRSCAYVAGLKNFYEKNPKQKDFLTYWHRHDVVYAALVKYITRWNANPSARENDTFRGIFIALNAMLQGEGATTSYIFNPASDMFHPVKQDSDGGEEQHSDGNKKVGSIFGLPGGTLNASGEAGSLLSEVESVYQILTQDPAENSSVGISFEEFAQLYKDDIKYVFSGKLAESAKEHINDPAWSAYVAQLDGILQRELSDAKIRQAYDAYLQDLASDGGSSVQAAVQEYLKGLSKDIMEAYRQNPAVWLGVLQDAFPVFNMYGGLPEDIRHDAAAVMRREIEKFQDQCARPGFFSVTTLKGLGNMLTLGQNKDIQNSILADAVKANGQCSLAVKSAIALAALGDGGNGTQDSQAIQTLFKKGFNGGSSGLVIPASLTALSAMGAYSSAADLIIYAGNETEGRDLLDDLGSAFSIGGWAQMFQSGNSRWYTNARLEYSYYTDENGEQRNVWVDTADLLVEAYAEAEREEQAKMAVLFSQSLTGLLSPGEKQLRMSLRPFLAGVFSHGLVNVKLSDKDKGFVAFNGPEVLVNLNQITDKKNKKAIKEMFNAAYNDQVPYAGVIIWYLFLSNKNDLHPKMRLYLNERLYQALMYTGGTWHLHAREVLDQQEAELQGEIDDFNRWAAFKAEVAPLDDLIGIFFLYQGGRGVFSLLKAIGTAARTSVTGVVKMLRMMRSVNIVKTAGLGKNLMKVLKVGLKNFKSKRFAGLKVSAFREVKASPEIPAFKPGAAPAGRPASVKPAAATKPVVEAPAPKAELRSLNGEQYVVFEGTETAYVRGQVVWVNKGTSLADVARQYGVAESEVAWALDGSTWAGVKPTLNFGAGEAAPGSQGVYPRVDRPQIKVPEPTSRVDASSWSGSTVRNYQPAPLKVRHISNWEWFKADLAVRWDSFKSGLGSFARFSVKNPFRAAGFSASTFSMGGAMPAELFPTVAEVSSTAPRGFSFYELANVGAEASSLPRVASAPAAAAEAAPALETLAASANTGIQNGRVWLNPFWLFGGATSSHISLIGAIPSADIRRFSGRSGAFNAYRLGQTKQLMLSALDLYKQDMFAPQDNWFTAAWNRAKYAGAWMNVHLNPYYKYYAAHQLGKMSAAADTDEHHDDDLPLSGGGTAADAGQTAIAAGEAEDVPLSAAVTPEKGGWERLFDNISASFTENPALSTLSGLAISLMLLDGLSGSLGMDGVAEAGMTAGLFAFLSPASPFKEDSTPGKPNTIKTKSGTVTYTYQRIAFNAQTQDLRILKEGESVPDGYEAYTMAANYGFMSSAQGIKGFEDKKLAVLYSNTIAKLVMGLAKPSRQLLVWVLASAADPSYKLQAFEKMQQLQYELVTKQEVIAAHNKISAATIAWNEEDWLALQEIANQRIEKDADLMKLFPSDQPVLLSGVLPESLANINQEKLLSALYNADLMKDFLEEVKVTDTNRGHKKYSGLLPVYVRAENGTISAEPKVYINLNGMSFTVPRGFMVVLDELGQIKFVPQDLREVDAVGGWFKGLEKLASIPGFGSILNLFRDKSLRLVNAKSSDRHIVFEQSLSASELAGLSRILSENAGNNNLTAVLDLREKDAFPKLMFLLSMIAGADLGASMSSQFKAVMPFAVLAILISGFGYFSPIVANWFKSAINKHGYYKTVRASLVAMLGISALAFVSGINWHFEFNKASAYQQGLGVLFALSAITIASILSTVASPIMKGAYPDATVFASKNMGFTTSKGLARLIVTLAPVLLGGVLGSVLGDANWSSLIPVMGGITVLALVYLQRSRLAAENENSSVSSSPISKQEAKDIYKDKFSQPLSSMVRRVALVYMTYAVINSVILGGEMGMLYSKDTALLITAAGLFLSWLVRKGADHLIKNKTITDDELTGMGLPLMMAGVAAYLLSPAGSAGMWFAWLMMYMSTPVFGVVENSRMQNAVAKYYAQARDKVVSDYLKKKEAVQKGSLSAKDKEAKLQELEAEKENLLKRLKDEEKAIKMEASGSYNKANSMGLVSIIILAGLFAMFKDWSPETLGGVNEFFRSLEAQIEPGVLDEFSTYNADPANVDKQKDILDFAIYRLGAVLPLVFSAILVMTNKGMVKDGVNRLTQSVVLTQADIDDGNDVLGKLHFDNDQAATYIDRVQKELQELGKMLDIGVKSFMSESNFFQPVVNRLVWVNNRLNALIRASNVSPAVLSAQLQSLRQITHVLRALVANNDVSEDFRHQVEMLCASVDSIKVDTDEATQQLLQSLTEYGAAVNNQEYTAKIQDIQGYIARGDKERLQIAFKAVEQMLLKNKVLKRSSKELSALKQQMNAVIASMEDGVGNVTSVSLNYLPEVKLSFTAWLTSLLPGKDPSKGIFSGTETDDYEHSKLFVSQLRLMQAEKLRGEKPKDGDRQAFLTYYVAAKTALKNYVKTIGHDEERVSLLNAELDDMLNGYMGTLTAAERQQIEGLLSEDEATQLQTLEQWLDELISMFKSLLSSFDDNSPAPEH